MSIIAFFVVQYFYDQYIHIDRGILLIQENLRVFSESFREFQIYKLHTVSTENFNLVLNAA